MSASIGSMGEASDNALAESTIGPFKLECIGKRSPFYGAPLKTIGDVEYATMGWIDWFNNRHLHGELDFILPAEYEANYYAETVASRPEKRPV